MSQATLSAESTSNTAASSVKRRRRFSAAVEGYLYLLPTLIGLAVFVYWPIVESFRLSLNRVAPFGNQMRFVGFENYIRLLTDREYWDGVRITFIFVLGTVPTGIALAVLLAILLAYPVRHLGPLHHTLIFVPVVISSAVAGVLFRWLYHPVVGYLNYWMVQLGLFDSMKDAPNWLADKEWALVAVIIATTWRQLGFNVFIALAGVQNIDQTFYDAAKVDGANALRRLRHITLPSMRASIAIVLVIEFIAAFQIFDVIWTLTSGGGSGGAINPFTKTLMIYNYELVFMDLRIGLGAALSYLVLLMSLAVGLVFVVRLYNQAVEDKG